MNILQRVIAALTVIRQGLPEKSDPKHQYQYILPNRDAGITITNDTAWKFSAFWRGVNAITGPISTLPLHIMRNANGRKERVEGSRIERLLHVQANPEMGARTFRELLTSWALSWGNGRAVIERDSGNRAVALWPMYPDRVTVVRDPDSGELFYQIWNAAGGYTYLRRQDVFDIAGLGSDGISGFSVVGLAATSIGAGMAAERFQASFYRNNTQVGGVLEYPHPMDEETLKRLRETWEAGHQGPATAWRPAILENGMTWKPNTMSQKDAEFIDSRKFSVIEMARWFGVPPHKLYDLERATFCLPAGSQVFTEHGPKSIETIKKGERVWSLAENREVRLAVVNATICNGEDNIYTIKTTNRTLRANKAHRVLVRRKYPSPTSGIGGYQSIEWRDEYVRVDQLKRGDTLVTLKTLPTGGNTHTPSGRGSLGFMEFCGLLVGDGNIYENWGVRIARHKDASYMPHYLNTMRKEFRKYDGGNGRGNVVVETAPIHIQESERYCGFASVLAAVELEALGFAGTAKTKAIPEWIFAMDLPHRLAFLRGFLDADGSVDKKGRISYGSSNKDLLIQIRHLCMSCGIPVTNMRNQCGTTKLPNGKNFDYSFWNFTCSDPGANRSIGSHDHRYIERFKNGKPFEKKARNYPRYGGKGFESEFCELSRISSITIGDPEPVYDLNIAGTHNFIAEGVVVHNSNIEHQAIEFVVDTLTPWAKRWEEEVDTKLLTREPTQFAKLNLNALLRGDTRSRAEFYKTMSQLGVFSINEIRELEDMNPIPEGDVRLVQMQMVPLERAIEPPEPQPMIAQQPEEPPNERLVQAFRALFADAALRILHIEAQEISKVTDRYREDRGAFADYLGKFYYKHQSFLRKTLDAPIKELASLNNRKLNGSLDTTVGIVLDRYIPEHIAESKRLLLNAHHTGFDVAFWSDHERAQQISDLLIDITTNIALLPEAYHAHSETA